MRVSEVASLFVSDIVNDKGEINEVIHLSANQTKGTESRRVFVSKKAKQALKRYLQSNCFPFTFSLCASFYDFAISVIAHPKVRTGI
ncbi:MAG: site-specific integrase [Alphaproteobacteria bacterium]|nr:site-specific integrase [Alphaproteobacteria bacterium]MBL6777359.1 site-specific integrase [Alphaproteobacteria bacterium]